MATNKTIHIERVNEEIINVIFANPPVNLISPETVSELSQIVNEFTKEDQLKVVIFRSDTEEYFYNHFDLARFSEFPRPANSEDISIWTDLVLKLTHAPFISIGLIRGRTRGGGNELALSMDLRYASLEKALFGQPEVGTGILPGGGGTEWLPRFIGRDRAIEAILGSDDYNAETAERYGWVTRAIPDIELDSFVSDIAKRFASFDKQALIAAKAQINRATLPPNDDFKSSYKEFSASMAWPAIPQKLQQMGALVGKIGVAEMEKNLGYYLGAKGRG